MKSSRCILIPAIKKNVAFADDLVKKLDGVQLIQRAINKARMLEKDKNIIVLTDSEEISVICHRNGIPCKLDETLKFDDTDALSGAASFFVDFVNGYKTALLLWPYAPLVTYEDIETAYNEFVSKNDDCLVSVKGTRHQYSMDDEGHLYHAENGRLGYFVEIRAFMIFSIAAAQKAKTLRTRAYVINEGRHEIKNYHDWWVCEKLLRRKRIVFRVIGSKEIGMGHIYRALTLAHENTDHEVIFCCDEQSHLALDKIAGHEYPLETCKAEEIEDRIIALKPDLVINDILDTEAAYVKKLKNAGIQVVNFEDLGKGAKYADLVFNELFDKPQMKGKHIRWGHQYNFLRNEFEGAHPHGFKDQIKDVLVTFGGTDSGGLTLQVLKTIVPFCQESGIKIHVVVGPGYQQRVELARLLKSLDYDGIFVTSKTGVMSSIMEKTPVAVSSNGRTVYELAHMNIPSIIVAQHQREETHLFSVEERGFCNVGVYKEGKTEALIQDALIKVCFDHDYRKTLYDGMTKYNFLPNKKKVMDEMMNLLSEDV